MWNQLNSINQWFFDAGQAAKDAYDRDEELLYDVQRFSVEMDRPTLLKS